MSADPVSPEEETMNGVELIAAERRRQIEVEGYTPQHDAEHTALALVTAAMCYLNPNPVCEIVHGLRVPMAWPWPPEFWKPVRGDRARELVKAGALIAAEIDRLRGGAVADPVNPGVITYNREVLITVIVYHHRNGIEGCKCGWADLGKSYAAHVADVYEQSILAYSEVTR